MSQTISESGYERLEIQIAWYDSRSISAQRSFKTTKTMELIFAALIPFAAKVEPNTAAMLGVAITVLVGLQHVNKWEENWITYRSTCEALKHEKFSYLGESGVYEGKDTLEARRILVGRVESLISTEHSKWISRQEYEVKGKT